MNNLTLYLICQFWALPIQQKKRYHVKNMDQWGYSYLILAENIVGKEEIARHKQFLLFAQCFQKLSVIDASKRVSME